MAISKRTKAGRTVGYQVAVSLPNPRGGRGQRVVIGSYRTRKAAEAAERRAKDEIEAGTFVPPRVVQEAPKVWTVGELVGQWLTGRKATVTANTWSTYQSAYALHIRETLADRDVADLTRADVRALVHSWQAAGMGAQLQNRAMLVLRGALDVAVEDGLIPANPATGIKLPSPKKRRDLPQWSPADLRRFLAEAERDQLGAGWHLLALEGMRRAEMLGLRWSDIQWGAGEALATATVTQTVVPDQAAGGAALIQPRAKTRGSQRTVSLTGPTVAALKRHRERQRFQQRAAGELWAGRDLIVCDEIGRPVRPDSVDIHRGAVMKAADVPIIGTHGLRHLAVTRMLQAGVPIATVAQKVGHADVGLTYATYAHWVPEDQAAANEAIEAFVSREDRTSTG